MAPAVWALVVEVRVRGVLALVVGARVPVPLVEVAGWVRVVAEALEPGWADRQPRNRFRPARSLLWRADPL